MAISETIQIEVSCRGNIMGVVL